MKILTLAQVATLLRLHRSTVYRMVKRGEIPAVKVGRVWRFSQDALDTWLSGGARRNAEPRRHGRPARKQKDPILQAIGILAIGTLSKDVDTALYGGP